MHCADGRPRILNAFFSLKAIQIVPKHALVLFLILPQDDTRTKSPCFASCLLPIRINQTRFRRTMNVNSRGPRKHPPPISGTRTRPSPFALDVWMERPTRVILTLITVASESFGSSHNLCRLTRPPRSARFWTVYNFFVFVWWTVSAAPADAERAKKEENGFRNRIGIANSTAFLSRFFRPLGRVWWTPLITFNLLLPAAAIRICIDMIIGDNRRHLSNAGLFKLRRWTRTRFLCLRCTDTSWHFDKKCQEVSSKTVAEREYSFGNANCFLQFVFDARCKIATHWVFMHVIFCWTKCTVVSKNILQKQPHVFRYSKYVLPKLVFERVRISREIKSVTTKRDPKISADERL